MYVIVGLGNPGDRYAGTKHNIGFITIDYLAEQSGIKLNKTKHKAILGEGTIGGEKVLLVKPQTFMNLSGQSVMDIVNFYKVPSQNLIVIYDDIDLPVGKVRIRPSGSSGTHNGMRNIIYLINNQEFPRIRIGVGKQPDYMDLADYVMTKFNGEEKPLMEDAVKRSAMAVEEIVKSGINIAMNKYNK
ncbi:MAG: peptidyl-tRNA hydrolase [Clostridia bacterium]|jgi:PTH1 family peptidyl-tRNA hydrolase|nr:peptidyl-tRNA hydrolase [Clostridia bacterium]